MLHSQTKPRCNNGKTKTKTKNLAPEKNYVLSFITSNNIRNQKAEESKNTSTTVNLEGCLQTNVKKHKFSQL
jgi:hypothetical protein